MFVCLFVFVFLEGRRHLTSIYRNLRICLKYTRVGNLIISQKSKALKSYSAVCCFLLLSSLCFSISW